MDPTRHHVSHVKEVPIKTANETGHAETIKKTAVQIYYTRKLQLQTRIAYKH